MGLVEIGKGKWTTKTIRKMKLSGRNNDERGKGKSHKKKFKEKNNYRRIESKILKRNTHMEELG